MASRQGFTLENLVAAQVLAGSMLPARRGVSSMQETGFGNPLFHKERPPIALVQLLTLTGGSLESLHIGFLPNLVAAVNETFPGGANNTRSQ